MAANNPRPLRQFLRLIGLGFLGTCVAFASLATALATTSMATASTSAGSPGPIDLNSLSRGQILEGFRTDAVYLVDSGKPMGARFKHVRSGFTFDLLSVQTAPQAFMWVNTPPSSDMGEPHTQEHLLLGKGNKGRSVATLEEMSMTSSTAMTMQWRTCYHFNTTAGADVFYEQVQRRLDALLHPDYTDVEVAREVRNFGVSKDSKDGILKLEEKGTVYNEMVSNVKSRGHNLYRAQQAALYGKEHPLYFMSGGSPAGLRRLTPDDIRAFRKTHYVLHNMGMIAALPKSMATRDVLSHMNAILSSLEPDAVPPGYLDRSDVPAFPPPNPVPASANQIEIVPYPEKDAEKPGTIQLFWPAVLKLAPDQELLLGLFLGNLAGDPATPLYKKFIDRRTRFMDLGATGVWAAASDDLGFPISIGLSSVARDNINEKVVSLVREQVEKELEAIASWKDGSAELAAFNGRLRDRIIATRRSYGKFVNSPPGFGNRWQGSGWMGTLLTVGRGGGFYRSVTMKPEIAFAEKELSKKTNIWSRYLKEWRLLGTRPFAFATFADPSLLTREEAATKTRLAEETARLKKLYGAENDQAALKAYQADYERQTRDLEELARQDKPAKLVDSLPLTDDDQLDYKVGTLAGVPIVSSTFDSMTGATAGLALRADSVDGDDLLYLGFLPTMINQVGVIVNGKPITYEQMLDLWRREILSVGCSFSTNIMTDRCELVMRGSGNDTSEVERAIVWMERLLEHPDWRTQNLPRIRDVLDQNLTSLRNARQSGYEESWVHSVSTAYFRQDWPLYLHTRCFLTRVHDAQRLRWLLKGDGDQEIIKAFVAYMKRLSALGDSAKPDDLKVMLGAMQEQASNAEGGNAGKEVGKDTSKGSPQDTGKETGKGSPKDTGKEVGKDTPHAAAEKLPDAMKALLTECRSQPKALAALTADAAKDLAQDLSDIPEASLGHDWGKLCAEISTDVQVPPAKTLARFDRVRKKLLTTGGARLFVIGAGGAQQKIQTSLKTLLQGLGSDKFVPVKYDAAPFVIGKLRERAGATERPLYVGFVNSNTAQGVFLNSAPALKYSDLDEDSLLNYLAFLQYAGGGAHSIFMKTWGAGLAYGNGLRVDPNGRMSYYADKTPALPDTIKFVAEQLKTAPAHLDLNDYAVAGAFSSMAAQAYESRGESMASSLVDDEPPDVVKRFRLAILELRKKPALAEALRSRMLAQYGRVVPGLGVRGEDVPGAVYMVIGDEKQMNLYEQYLKSVAGQETKLCRIYGRDFWHYSED